MTDARRTVVRGQILEFFRVHPECWAMVDNQPTDPILWEMIFYHCFGEEPKDDGQKPKKYRKGQTDPRWNDLLHDCEGLKSFYEIIEAHAK